MAREMSQWEKVLYQESRPNLVFTLTWWKENQIPARWSDTGKKTHAHTHTHSHAQM